MFRLLAQKQFWCMCRLKQDYDMRLPPKKRAFCAPHGGSIVGYNCSICISKIEKARETRASISKLSLRIDNADK